jgi:heterodisulfide reductase subunit A-like polyferredoxin
VDRVEGSKGNFKVTGFKTPRYIDTSKCTGCGDCAQVCPVVLPNEYDQGLTQRKAAFKKYAQAIPAAFAIQKADKAPCRLACPAGLNVQGYVQMVSQGQYKEALEIIMDRLPLPGVLGRICPHGCEDACRRCEVDDPVAIRDLKRLAADQFDPRKIEIACMPPRQEKVAIVGSGPAGLSAAYHLARKGVLSVIFEALPEPGGMLRVGIPAHRLPREGLDREIEVITNLGVEIRTGTPLGPALSVEDLFNEGYRAVYLATGAHKGIELGIPGEKSEGVVQGVDFLREMNLTGKTPVGKKVAVIGGGNVAIDVARSAVRLGAEEISIIYRRTRAEMPAWEEEICATEAEGISIAYLSAPQEVLTRDGIVVGLRCIRMRLGEADSSGRRRPIPIPGSEYDMVIDQLIPAIGQVPDLSALEEVPELGFSRWGTIKVDPVTYATDRNGVFAGGDLQTGPWVAIGAIAAGMEAAESILRYMDGRDMAEGREARFNENPSYRPIPKNEPVKARPKMPDLPVDDRQGNFREVELGYDHVTGQAEASRCLNCGYCCECFQCVKACGAGAVTLKTHAQEREPFELEVGSIILAPGFHPFDPSKFETYNYAGHPNIVTSMDFERILSASGPTMGHLVRFSDHREPKKIAWLQCVGSRDINKCDHGYCSSVCCMYAIKEAVIAKEHAGPDLDCAVFFMDMRTHGKDFERYYDEAKKTHGIRFVRSRVHTVDVAKGRDDLLIRYASEEGELIEESFEMVVLSVGLEIPHELGELAGKLGLDVTEGGFCQADSFHPTATSREGIYGCGAFQGPKDIPQSVIEASSAAAQSGALLSGARNTLTRTRPVPEERNVSGERPRIGVFVCQCGINIGGVVNVDAVRDYAKGLPYVEFVTDNLYTCSQDTQEIMAQAIKDSRLNRVVVAACTPKTHEPLFQETLINAGLNKYLFEMTNIRNQDSWVHKDDPESATWKAKDLVRMAVSKVALMEPLQETEVKMTHRALVVGGGISGMVAARALSGEGYPVCLVERSSILGGQAWKIFRTWKGEDVRQNLRDLIRSVENDLQIDIRLDTEITDVEGFVGNFKTTLASNGNEEMVEHGIAVIATGATELKPVEYLYGQEPRVLTHLELDQRFMDKPEALQEIGTAVFIQCVGSREPERPYCSRVCCTHSIESALYLKELNPEMNITILYRDIRTYGEREYLYRKARDSGIVFIRYSAEQKPGVSSGSDGVTVEVTDHILKRPVLLHADLLVLASAIDPYRDKSLSQFFKIPVNEDGFFVEAHAKLGPSEFATDGLFLCGMAHYPKPIDESVAQAQAAASRAVTLLAGETVRVSGTVACVSPSFCSGCGVCVQICPYSAPLFIEEGPLAGKAEVNPVLCKGCGLCVASCRSGALTLKGFAEDQIMAMINEI